MNKSALKGIIVILVITIIALSALLYGNQQTIKQQQAHIASQDQKIAELQTQVNKLSAATPENILKLTGQFAKEKGAGLLKQILSK